MSRKLADELSRRERQIMDVVYARGEATAAELRAETTIEVPAEGELKLSDLPLAEFRR